MCMCVFFGERGGREGGGSDDVADIGSGWPRQRVARAHRVGEVAAVVFRTRVRLFWERMIECDFFYRVLSFNYLGNIN